MSINILVLTDEYGNRDKLRNTWYIFEEYKYHIHFCEIKKVGNDNEWNRP